MAVWVPEADGCGYPVRPLGPFSWLASRTCLQLYGWWLLLLWESLDTVEC